MQNLKTRQQLARRAVKIFPMRDYATRSAVIHQRKGWLRSVLQLGKKWILSTDRDGAVLIVCITSALILAAVPA
jgi:hypothetical protein